MGPGANASFLMSGQDNMNTGQEWGVHAKTGDVPLLILPASSAYNKRWTVLASTGCSL
jgi:hypothetical protein